MKDIDNLSFKYNEYVNNLPNQGESINNLVQETHRLVHKDQVDYVDFYSNFYDLELNLAKEYFWHSQLDLEMYIDWLGNDGTRN